jgi:hypothetical protein
MKVEEKPIPNSGGAAEVKVAATRSQRGDRRVHC